MNTIICMYSIKILVLTVRFLDMCLLKGEFTLSKGDMC